MTITHFPHWQNKRVALIGARVVGSAVAEALLREGVGVDIFEDHPEPVRERLNELERFGARIVAPHPEWASALQGSSAVIPSPGVPPHHPALGEAARLGLPIVGDLDVAAPFLNGRTVVAVTGTNGKTTVTQLIEAVLNAGGIRSMACGNFGIPLIAAATDESIDAFVVEVSSFQLHYANSFAPQIGVLTSLAEDHLDWHGSFANYAADKARVFRHFTSEEVLVADIGDQAVAAMTAESPLHRFGYAVDGQGIVHIDGRGSGSELNLAGCLPEASANVVETRNRIAAAAVARRMGIAPALVRSALEQASRFPHRLELIGQALGVRYIDDSKATNPHATLAALDGLDSVILIAGGRNKGLDFQPLRGRAQHLKLVVGIGEAAQDVVTAFEGAVPTRIAASMHEAVVIASQAARSGDTVLLSPACASFDWYGSYSERGDDFAREVHAVTGATR